MFSTLCLALVVYVEARGEPLDGQMLVAEVVLNRTKSEDYPDTICEVAFEPHQFSGIDGNLDLVTIFEDKAWDTSVDVATEALAGHTLGTKATHYHNAKVKPCWIDSMDKLGVYGKHTFYEEIRE